MGDERCGVAGAGTRNVALLRQKLGAGGWASRGAARPGR
jgi:hypothetical protein